ncbi:MAG: YdcF family protein [Proteobacteria bacterium]|nr:YdcF family protein [Pseudomonadota bacterium]
MTSFIVLKILSTLALPPASLAVAAVLCLLLLAVRLRRLGVAVLILGVAQTVIMAFPPVADAMMSYLEAKAREAEKASPRCCFDAIVVLGGGIMPAVLPQRPVPDLNDAADRIWQAARFYHQGVAPKIIVSGGGFLALTNAAATTEAAAMRLFLMDLGVPADAIVSEDRSVNTIENLREVRRMVGDGRVALVTSAYHMPRALRIAAREKLAVSAFPVDFRSQLGMRPAWEEWIPSVEGLSLSTTALREIVALKLDWRIDAEGK